MGRGRYCVTAVNKISGERVRISPVVSKEEAVRIRDANAAITSRNKAYVSGRVVPFPFQEEWLDFGGGGRNMPSPIVFYNHGDTA